MLASTYIVIEWLQLLSLIQFCESVRERGRGAEEHVWVF